MRVSIVCDRPGPVVAARFFGLPASAWPGSPVPTAASAPSAAGVAAANNEIVSRRLGLIAPSSSLSRHPFDVRQAPCLVEHRLLRAVKTKQHLELPVGAGRHPVALLVPRRPRS